MAVIYTEGFESDGNGTRYTTSVAEFSDGDGDFFTRTDGSIQERDGDSRHRR